MNTQKNPSNNLPIIRYNFSGSGIEHAMQESINTKTNFSYVYDMDKTGNVIHVGYFLVSRETNEQVSPIQWFTKEEIQINLLPENTTMNTNSSLNINFKHPKDNERHFILSIPLGIKKMLILRILFRLEKNLTSSFVVQAELKYSINGRDKHFPLVRYDCKHGFIHRDLINSSGKKLKEKLPTQNSREAIELAVNELRDKLNIWIKQLGYGKITSSLPLDNNIDALNNAKKTILDLFENPSKIQDAKSSFYTPSVKTKIQHLRIKSS